MRVVLILLVACLAQMPLAWAEEEGIIDGRVWAGLSYDQKMDAVLDVQGSFYFIMGGEDYATATYIEQLNQFYADANNESVDLWDAMLEIWDQLEQEAVLTPGPAPG